MYRRSLTDDEIEAFRRDGVVHIPGAFPADLVPRAIAAVDDELRHRYGDGVRASTGMTRRLYRDNEEFRCFAFESGLAGLAAQATGSETIRLYFEQVFVKDPGAADVFHWHQDNPFWPISGTQVCSTWVALTGASVESSALEFVRGSHAWGITYRPYFGGPTEVEKLDRIWPNFGSYVASFPDEVEVFEDHPERFDVIGFDVEPGDALLFDYRIVHRSRGNGSPHRRVAVSWRWLGDDARWSPVPGADPVVSAADTWLEPGALITDDDAFPIVHGSHRMLQSGERT